jgi:hypothetical protein
MSAQAQDIARTMLKLVSAPSQQSEESYAVFDGARCIGHILRTTQSPQGKPWFWTVFVRSPHDIHDRGYAASREEAMADLESRSGRAKPSEVNMVDPKTGRIGEKND